ncbi:hypothetical protein [Paenirhodobacter sp.]|uniref:hypothetical protein n=1 Tax=Paenirhodobacter sp. TaxID=1965326 RepID=UPI003B4144D3
MKSTSEKLLFSAWRLLPHEGNAFAQAISIPMKFAKRFRKSHVSIMLRDRSALPRVAAQFVSLHPCQKDEHYLNTGSGLLNLVMMKWLWQIRRGYAEIEAPESIVVCENLFDQSIEDVALDLKCPNVASVHRRHKDLVELENVRRAANRLEKLRPVSARTVSTHIKSLGVAVLTIARDGERATTNNCTRGRTDTQALMVGDLVEIDECKISLIAIVRRVGMWQRLSSEEKAALEELSEYVKTRLWLVLALDVATRMPVGWVLTDAPGGDATLEALRMATRSKDREKIIYECELDPMPPIGIACIRNDNGSGLRNSAVKTALLGLASQVVDVRAYHSGDKPYIERMFGGLEARLYNLIHGFTGNRAGALKGYDAMKSAAFVREELYAMITKYLIDEYPSERHYGTDFFGQRPIKVAERLAKEGWAVPPISPQDRRLHLGWRFEATITDEGVKVLGLPFNSPELQRHRDSECRKVAVYLDPDRINEVTILVRGCPDQIMADLSWSAMRDMTLAEYLSHVEAVRAEDPLDTKDFDLRLARIRNERFEMLRRVAIERDIPCSYMTLSEAQAKADRLTTGMHAHRPEHMPGTVAPGMIGKLGELPEAWDIGGGLSPAIEGQTEEAEGQPVPFGRPDTKGKLK